MNELKVKKSVLVGIVYDEVVEVITVSAKSRRTHSEFGLKLNSASRWRAKNGIVYWWDYPTKEIKHIVENWFYKKGFTFKRHSRILDGDNYNTCHFDDE